MRRDQLEHAIRTACQIIEQPEVIIVGSQAVSTRKTSASRSSDAFREKDINFVGSLLDAGLTNPAVIANRVATVPAEHAATAERALDWIASRR